MADDDGHTFNLNDQFLVFLTDKGKEYALPYWKVLPSGAYKMQGWEFMQVFGPLFYNGGPNLVVKNAVRLA
jgi:hypothetical protein